jgi:hypothetical protein
MATAALAIDTAYIDKKRSTRVHGIRKKHLLDLRERQAADDVNAICGK